MHRNIVYYPDLQFLLRLCDGGEGGQRLVEQRPLVLGPLRDGGVHVEELLPRVDGLADRHPLLLEQVAQVLQLVTHVAHRRVGQIPLALLSGPV